MTELYYVLMFGISLVLSMLYMLKWHKHFDVHFTLIFCLVPVATLGNMLIAQATNTEEAQW